MLDGAKAKLDGAGAPSLPMIVGGGALLLFSLASIVYALSDDTKLDPGSRVKLAAVQQGAVRVPDDNPPSIQPVITTTQPAAGAPAAENDTLARRQAPAVIFNSGVATGQPAPIRPTTPPEQVPTYTASYTQAADADFTIMTGRQIPATLLTEVSSDLPGPVVAVISQPVYGETGRMPVLKRGTRLFGRSLGGVRAGQDRVGILWTRAIAQRDDGSTMTIDFASAGTDQLGTIGMTGEVDSHFWEIFGNAILISLVGAGASAVPAGDNQFQDNVIDDARTTTRQAVGDRLNIPPTVHVPHGESINVIVQQDLFFPRDQLAAAAQQPIQIVQ